MSAPLLDQEPKIKTLEPLQVFQPFSKFWFKRFRRLLAADIGVILLASTAATSVLLTIRHFGGLQPLELITFDQMVRVKPDGGPDPRLLIVGITEADIQSQKQFPLSDQAIAQTLEALQQYQPKAIGLDIFRDIPHEPGSQQLAEQLAKPNVIAITYVGNAPEETVPPPPKLKGKQVGFSDILTDPDSVVRRNLMFTPHGNTTLTSFSLLLALKYLDGKVTPTLTKAGAFQLGETVFTKLEPSFGGYRNIDAQAYQILLNYRSGTDVARQITLQQVLSKQLNPSWIKDKVVLIGFTAPSAKDLLYTPYSSSNRKNRLMPGVAIHAQMVSQVLSSALDAQPVFWTWENLLETIWILGWGMTGGIFTWRIRRWLIWLLGSTAILGLLFSLGFSIFLQAGWIPLMAPASAFILASISVALCKLFYFSLHDDLTKLPNRTIFLRRLRKTIAHNTTNQSPRFAVLFLDLDRFKTVNDNLGHQIGDQLLLRSSQRLKDCLRPQDTLARVGGDEFAILLQGIRDASEVTHVADHLQQELANPFQLGGHEIFTSISIGIAMHLPESSVEPEDLLRDAHTAMYQAKAFGRERCQVFAAPMRTQVVRRVQIETELRQAIHQQQFQLHYQPIITLGTGEISGFEALARWLHPQYGFISPAEFIPVAEETGLIVPLGRWILQTACQQLKHWQTDFPEASLTISVNLSSRQLAQANLVEEIQHILQITQLEGCNLKLEITESVAMQDVEAAIKILLQLKKLALQLSIDDFGTGYSSLSYLHRLPIDTLKIDRSFISHMSTAAEDVGMVRSILELAHSLGMTVVAEGIETEDQLTQLRSLNCEYGQGYFLSKPLPSQAAEALLRKTVKN